MVITKAALTRTGLSTTPTWQEILDTGSDQVFQAVFGRSTFSAFVLSANDVYYTSNIKVNPLSLQGAPNGAGDVTETPVLRATAGLAGGVSVCATESGMYRNHYFSFDYGKNWHKHFLGGNGGDIGHDVDDYNLGIVICSGQNKLNITGGTTTNNWYGGAPNWTVTAGYVSGDTLYAGGTSGSSYAGISFKMDSVVTFTYFSFFTSKPNCFAEGEIAIYNHGALAGYFWQLPWGDSGFWNTPQAYTGSLVGDEIRWSLHTNADPSYIISGSFVVKYISTGYGSAFQVVGGTINCLDGSTSINGIRIPYRRLDNQSNNNNINNMNCLIGMNAPVGGITFASINIDAATLQVTGSQTDITPIISGTTYVPIASPNNFETYGGNSQRILLLAKPDGGGTTHLLASTDGGATWSIKQSSIIAVHVHFVEPSRHGDGSKCWISGIDGVFYSTDLGATLSDKTNNLTAILGGNAIGALQF